ncbi:MAG: hypothetical protein HOZ81_20800 [Streptomyces sp.]|nr:hypothetical protein [Streptomyces sp.]
MRLNVCARIPVAKGRTHPLIAVFVVLTLLAGLLRATPAHAEETVPADRSIVVSAWQAGGPQVRSAAEAALLGSDDQVIAFLVEGWPRAQRLDQRDTLASVISDGGPSVRAKAQAALDADAAGDQDAIPTFLNSGWQSATAIDARVSVNQLMSAGGEQVKQAAQAVLDSGDTEALQKFLDSGWQVQWNTDQRLRVDQAIATGGPQVRASGQKALDAGTPEALEAFLAYGWAVASARDEETATLQDLLGQARAARDLAAQETANATSEADRAKDAAAAARDSADEAAEATASARDNMAEAKAQAKRAAVAAHKAAEAARVAIQAAAAANRAARAASTAAARAAQMAMKASRSAAEAYRQAGAASVDGAKAGEARRAAEAARTIAEETRDFAAQADAAGKAIQAGNDAIASAKAAADHALAAAAANDEAVRHANAAGAAAQEAVAAAATARANAERAVRAARAAENYLRVAANAAFKARDAANRAASDAEAAAVAAFAAAEHAGEAGEAAVKATEYANRATAAAENAVTAAGDAAEVFEAARTADAERLAVARDEGLETARAANVAFEEQQRVADWDLDQAAKRDAETNRLIAVALNPATERAAAVTAARQVALHLAGGQGAWTKQAALGALGSTDDLALEFVRTGVADAAAQDNRLAVTNLAVTENAALATAARTAMAGDDQTVATFLRTQNYPGRYSADRMKVNQILAAANAAGDVVLAQRAQQALDADTLQAFRDFLDTGRQIAAATGERVLVNQILASPDSGPEVKAAAQIALDGPVPGLQKFLSTGRFTAAERDNEGAIHLAVVAGLLKEISQVAETAVQSALEAQALAARARGDAVQAASYAQQATDSATRATGYAQQARTYASQAAASVQKATTAVQAAREASTRANASARTAIRSATWAIASHQNAVESANRANQAARAAYNTAIQAGEDAEAAVEAAKSAFAAYEAAYGAEIVRCMNDFGNEDVQGWERIFDGTQNEYPGNCVRNLVADPDELASRAYVNSAFCDLYREGSQDYQDCVNSTLDPDFTGMSKLIFAYKAIQQAVAPGLIWVGATVGVGCLLTVCGAVTGTIMTMGNVGLELYRFIQGDQSLAQTLLNLGTGVLESLLLRGIGKVLSVGFRAIKLAYTSAKTGERVTSLIKTELALIKKLNVRLAVSRMYAGDYSSPPGKAVFWSGRTGSLRAGPERAEEIARSEGDGAVTLEMLMDSRGIPQAEWVEPPDPLVRDAWTHASETYARGVSGEVRVVLGEEVRENSIWLTRELPALKDNPKVTKIIVIDLTTLTRKVIFER